MSKFASIILLVCAVAVSGRGVPEPQKERQSSECGNTFPNDLSSDDGVAEFEQPWRVELRPFNILFSQALDCGGVLLSEKYVLTAAHCVDGPGWYLTIVRIGDHYVEELRENYPYRDYRIRRKILHENFERTGESRFVNDIALLELTSAVHFRNHIRPACLPEEDENFAGEEASLPELGPFDFTQGSRTFLPKKAHLVVTENDFCEALFAARGIESVLPDKTLCASFKTPTCGQTRALAGSPLVLESSGQAQAIGIVSWSEPCAFPNEPGLSKVPTVFTNISSHMEWIHSNMKA